MSLAASGSSPSSPPWGQWDANEVRKFYKLRYQGCRFGTEEDCPESQYQVFISHRGGDLHNYKNECLDFQERHLDKIGLKAFVDVSALGQDTSGKERDNQERIFCAISHCKVFVAVIDPGYFTSDCCIAELQMALDLGKITFFAYSGAGVPSLEYGKIPGKCPLSQDAYVTLQSSIKGKPRYIMKQSPSWKGYYATIIYCMISHPRLNVTERFLIRLLQENDLEETSEEGPDIKAKLKMALGNTAKWTRKRGAEAPGAGNVMRKRQAVSSESKIDGNDIATTSQLAQVDMMQNRTRIFQKHFKLGPGPNPNIQVTMNKEGVIFIRGTYPMRDVLRKCWPVLKYESVTKEYSCNMFQAAANWQSGASPAMLHILGLLALLSKSPAYVANGLCDSLNSLSGAGAANQSTIFFPQEDKATLSEAELVPISVSTVKAAYGVLVKNTANEDYVLFLRYRLSAYLAFHGEHKPQQVDANLEEWRSAMPEQHNDWTVKESFATSFSLTCLETIIQNVKTEYVLKRRK